MTVPIEHSIPSSPAELAFGSDYAGFAQKEVLCAQLPELAALARQHSHANVLCFPARYVDEALTREIVSTFLETNFEIGRHQLRVSKINY